jgi:hypothetical protein
MAEERDQLHERLRMKIVYAKLICSYFLFLVLSLSGNSKTAFGFAVRFT